jgi:hypothetical protein
MNNDSARESSVVIPYSKHSLITSHGMTGRNFFDVFLPFYLLFGF